MNYKLTALERWVRFFLSVQLGVGGSMLWYSWLATAETLCAISGILLVTAAVGIRPLALLGSFFWGSGPTASTPDAA